LNIGARIAFLRLAHPSLSADAFVRAHALIIEEIRGTDATTLDGITSALNERGVRSARGGRRHESSVANLLARSQKFAQAYWSAFYRPEIKQTHGRSSAS